MLSWHTPERLLVYNHIGALICGTGFGAAARPYVVRGGLFNAQLAEANSSSSHCLHSVWPEFVSTHMLYSPAADSH